MHGSGSAQSLGQRIREARVDSKRSLRAAARELSLSPSYMNDIEFDRRVPSETVLLQIAEMFGLDPDQLLGAAGRVGADAEAYLKGNPTAGVLLRRVSGAGLGEKRLRELLDQVDKMRQEDSSD
jgi:transcriptional regulator with XRE-family HTH domain